MKNYSIVLGVFLMIACCAMLRGQQTRTEVTKTTTPFDDSKPNSPAVPEAYAVSSRFERVLVMRFKHDTDLLAGMEAMVRENAVHNAVILSGIGSVKSYHLHAVSNRSFPSKNVFVRDPTGPADLIGMNGYVFDGHIHAHLTLATPDNAFGGHLEPDTKVFTFAVVTVGVLGDEIDMKRMDDKTYR
jgi:predicted DNA-binding protein with PD1-like motif